MVGMVTAQTKQYVDERLEEVADKLKSYMSEAIAPLREEIRVLSAQVDGLNRGLSGEIKGLEGQHKGLEGQIEGSKSEIATLNRRYDTMENYQREMAVDIREIKKQYELIINLLTDRLPPKVEA